MASGKAGGYLNRIDTIVGILSKARYAIVMALSFVAFWTLLAATSNIISFAGGIQLNPFAEWTRVSITLITSFLFGLNAAVLLYGYDMKREVATGSSHVTAIGALTALFTSSCPVCHPLILAGLGLGCIGGLLSDLSIWIGILSAVMLAISLDSSLNATAGTCGSKVKR